ncbi:MAG: hypothetical protein ACREXY_17275, partial [Gammaproteobacteria bacterium]
VKGSKETTIDLPRSSEPVTAEMDALDRIRADSKTRPQRKSDAPKSEARRFGELRYQARLLAESLERKNLKSDAAAVHYNIAYMPTVELAPDGAFLGYTSTYDSTDEQNAALDRAHALGPSCPQVEFDAVDQRYRREGLLDMTSEQNRALRPGYIKETEQFLVRHGERMWPTTFTTLWRVYQQEGRHQEACDALRRWHAAEPTYFPSGEWTRLSESYSSWFRIKKLPARACPIVDGPSRDAVQP